MLPVILLVDDDPTTNFLSTRLLRRLGAAKEIVVALNGFEALQQLRQRCFAGEDAGSACPALVLLDVNRPVMDGFEFLAAYQQLPAGQRHPTVVIMLTTSMLATDRHRLPAGRAAAHSRFSDQTPDPRKAGGCAATAFQHRAILSENPEFSG